jgi:hypothetical protein
MNLLSPWERVAAPGSGFFGLAREKRGGLFTESGEESRFRDEGGRVVEEVPVETGEDAG